MMAKKQQQPQEAATVEVDLDALAAEAEKRVDILPKLTFGSDKLDEVTAVVEFIDTQPRPFAYESKFDDGETKKALSMNVRLIDATYDVVPGEYQLVMSADPTSGLTAGIMRLWKRNGKTLSGVKARIATRNYQHKQFGLTRGYYVTLFNDTSGDVVDLHGDPDAEA